MGWKQGLGATSGRDADRGSRWRSQLQVATHAAKVGAARMDKVGGKVREKVCSSDLGLGLGCFHGLSI